MDACRTSPNALPPAAPLDPPRPECVVDEDCSDRQACIQQRCQDPCALYDNCAPNAECYVTRHRPVCSCPDGYVGNPNIQCFVGMWCGDLIGDSCAIFT